MSRFGEDLEHPHRLHGGYQTPVSRLWQGPSVKTLNPHNLMWPIFITDDSNGMEEIKSLTGQYRVGVNKIVEYLRPHVENGLQSIMLFGVPGNNVKDATGSSAGQNEGLVVPAIKAIVKAYPDLFISCDVCLCAYTDHGHCGIFQFDGSIDNPASIHRLAEISLAYAKAGAHMVAPSDMMDGRILAIKDALAANGLDGKCMVLSYAAKFASAFYGPFRDAAKSAPGKGDRSGYQLPPGGRGLALRALDRDAEQGADMLMVKPGMPYLDVCRDAKERHPELPLAVYQVSGEFMMIHHAANAGGLALRPTVEETLVSFQRAGVDLIITYFTPQLLQWWQEDKK
eukprot:Clim_evm70s156 gene=Clim_evmTU70s156